MIEILRNALKFPVRAVFFDMPGCDVAARTSVSPFRSVMSTLRLEGFVPTVGTL